MSTGNVPAVGSHKHAPARRGTHFWGCRVINGFMEFRDAAVLHTQHTHKKSIKAGVLQSQYDVAISGEHLKDCCTIVVERHVLMADCCDTRMLQHRRKSQLRHITPHREPSHCFLAGSISSEVTLTSNRRADRNFKESFICNPIGKFFKIFSKRTFGNVCIRLQ